jgi:hypothetical protein
MMTTQLALNRAQSLLREALVRLFGPRLSGVHGFGAGLDHKTHELALRVTVDSPSSARRAEALPKTIEGLPVKVTQGRPARAD